MNISYETFIGERLDEDYEYSGGLLWDGEKSIVDKPEV